jgi:hypothetical protein
MFIHFLASLLMPVPFQFLVFILQEVPNGKHRNETASHLYAFLNNEEPTSIAVLDDYLIGCDKVPN